jgi:hypothetical protein
VPPVEQQALLLLVLARPVLVFQPQRLELLAELEPVPPEREHLLRTHPQ